MVTVVLVDANTGSDGEERDDRGPAEHAKHEAEMSRLLEGEHQKYPR
jgi:hypothetical protein